MYVKHCVLRRFISSCDIRSPLCLWFFDLSAWTFRAFSLSVSSLSFRAAGRPLRASIVLFRTNPAKFLPSLLMNRRSWTQNKAGSWRHFLPISAYCFNTRGWGGLRTAVYCPYCCVLEESRVFFFFLLENVSHLLQLFTLTRKLRPQRVHLTKVSTSVWLPHFFINSWTFIRFQAFANKICGKLKIKICELFRGGGATSRLRL